MHFRSLPHDLACLIAALGLTQAATTAQHATRIVDFNPGTGFATDGATGAGYTNTAAFLGEPSRQTPGPFGGPVDPFNPPYLPSQLISLGTGGSLTFELDPPAHNHPWNPFGVDFLLFGGAGFVITNGQFSGGGITDGSMFGSGRATVRISVSSNATDFVALDQARTPSIEGQFPTDGAGNFTRPVNPQLRPLGFAGLNLDGIRAAYAGAGGGSGFDLSWARDTAGNRVPMDEARYIRIEVLDGRIELDAAAAVTPVPLTPTAGVRPLPATETFDEDPAFSGWSHQGDPARIRWNLPERRLDLSWESLEPNARLLRPLGRSLTERDSFAFELDLHLDALAVGTTPGQPFSFQLAFGWFRLGDIAGIDVRRGTGAGLSNLVEWTFFPDSGFGPTVSPIAISGAGEWAWQPMTIGVDLKPGPIHRIGLAYDAPTRTLRGTLVTDGVPATLRTVPLPEPFAGFNVDTFSIQHYSDLGADGSISARGWIDNLRWSLPAHPVGRLVPDAASEGRTVGFNTEKGWTYRLEASVNLRDWSPASEPVAGTGAPMTLTDLREILLRAAFYRVVALRP